MVMRCGRYVAESKTRQHDSENPVSRYDTDASFGEDRRKNEIKHRSKFVASSMTDEAQSSLLASLSSSRRNNPQRLTSVHLANHGRSAAAPYDYC
jgi:hypothetical protein